MARFVVIKEILNFRNRPILADEHFIGSALLGEELELFEAPVPGEIPAGTDDDQWLSDNMNRFVSRAGVALKGTYPAKKAVFLSDPFNRKFIDENDKDNESKWKVSWGNVDLDIWKIWRDFNTKGEGVKVAVIDTGALSASNDLKGQLVENECFSFTSFDTNVDDKDGPLHGTKSSGVIGANGNNANSVVGVAPNCSLVIYQLFSRSETLADYTIDNFCIALQKARAARADVISMSFCTFETNAALEKEIDLCVKQGILLVASVGDVDQSRGIVNAFPASIKGCFSIGAYRLNTQKRTIFKEFSSQSNHLHCLAPGENILTCGANGQPAMHQFTSASAPFVAGLFALIVSFRKRKGLKVSTDIFLTKLAHACEKLEGGPQADSKEGLGVLEARKFFELLTT